MEGFGQLVIQMGALGLLGYLLYWTTQKGAPDLFRALGGIQEAMLNHSNRLSKLEESVDELRNELRKERPPHG